MPSRIQLVLYMLLAVAAGSVVGYNCPRLFLIAFTAFVVFIAGYLLYSNKISHQNGNGGITALRAILLGGVLYIASIWGTYLVKTFLASVYFC